MLPDMDDDKGTSLLLVHSEKGQKMLETVSSDIRLVSVEPSVAEKYNPAVTMSVEPSPKREAFLNDVKSGDFDEVAYMYTKPTLKQRYIAFLSMVKRIIKRVLKMK